MTRRPCGAARVREHLDAGADQVALTILSQDGQPRPMDVARELAGRFPADSGWPRVSRVKLPS